MTTFTDSPWSSPESDLSPEDFAKVSLIDLNPPGAKKTKDKIYLPIRSTPGGAVNKNALRAAAGALQGARGGLKGVPPAEKKKAAKTIVNLMKQAGIKPGMGLMKLAA